MKRLMSVIALILVGSFIGNSSVFGESIIFDVVNKALKNEVTYYDNHSAKIFDFIETTTNITEDEQKVETNIKLLAVAYKEVRGKIYYWDTSKLYYFDVDNNQIIDGDKVEINDTIQAFVNKHKNIGEKVITTGSFLLLMLSILLLVVIPLIIAYFHNSSRSREKLTIYKNNRVSF